MILSSPALKPFNLSAHQPLLILTRRKIDFKPLILFSSPPCFGLTTLQQICEEWNSAAENIIKSYQQETRAWRTLTPSLDIFREDEQWINYHYENILCLLNLRIHFLLKREFRSALSNFTRLFSVQFMLQDKDTFGLLLGNLFSLLQSNVFSRYYIKNACILSGSWKILLILLWFDENWDSTDCSS